ncbi:Protein kinase superfamily protein [Raphanus sativus]|uniref:Serine/threonine-protein kinase-like protein ACR4 n=1 Tax=Raphanus sativus TaxID=3726 RepID=A0A6J0LNF3_RAPSA|nr:serine/threonine-protein kinase-like protein ACR4 [Raphanus sativus]KAJ4901505.1 Protein kinase superfamily protein [Raphanus sativus]
MDKSEKIAYASVLSILSLFLLILIIFLLLLCRKKPIRSDESLLPKTKPAGTTYPLTELDSATDGFSQRRIIGTGRLGTVYAAVIPSHKNLVAVKRIHPGLVLSKPGSGFTTALKTLSSALHPNVVSILGFSEAPGERIVVTEFVGEAKSLSDHLHGDSEPAVTTVIDWRQRFRVAAGAARGLEYLHEIMNPRIVHGRFTSSNILVDEKFMAKVSDYGFAFLIPREKAEVSWYVEEGYCKESDVYGFGVVLLEILSGRRSGNGTIVKWATPLIKEQRFAELLDPRVVVQSEIKCLVIRLAKVALACVGNSRRSRPSVSQVAAILNSLEREGGGI